MSVFVICAFTLCQCALFCCRDFSDTSLLQPWINRGNMWRHIQCLTSAFITARNLNKEETWSLRTLLLQRAWARKLNRALHRCQKYTGARNQLLIAESPPDDLQHIRNHLGNSAGNADAFKYQLIWSSGFLELWFSWNSVTVSNIRRSHFMTVYDWPCL